MTVSRVEGSRLVVSGLGKRFGARWAVRGASFDVGLGEIVGLVGPNGSGKTTLFECLAGAAPATEGIVTADGVSLADADRSRALFYVPERIRPWPRLRLRHVLGAMSTAFGREAAAGAAVAERLGLGAFLDARMESLSKGEHRRALVAVGLLSTAPILLFDEPFDGLDLRQAREVASSLREAATAGRGLLLSIHQLGDAVRVCDRLILLSGGEVRASGTPDELRRTAGLAAGSLEEVFLALT